MHPTSASSSQEPTVVDVSKLPAGSALEGQPRGVVEGEGLEVAEGGVDVVAQELYDPHDEWAARDLLLSLVPFAVATALRDASFHAGLIFATVLAWLLLFSRLAFWHGRGKVAPPSVDLTNVVLFSILLGFAYRHEWHIHKWYNVITEGVFAIVMLATVLRMRGFTAHYARYSKFDVTGKVLWAEDVAWRHSCMHSSIAFAVAFGMATCLSLLPVLTNHFNGSSPLNIIFNYIVPLTFPLFTVIYVQRVVGRHYLHHSVRNRNLARGSNSDQRV